MPASDFHDRVNFRCSLGFIRYIYNHIYLIIFMNIMIVSDNGIDVDSPSSGGAKQPSRAVMDSKRPLTPFLSEYMHIMTSFER